MSVVIKLTGGKIFLVTIWKTYSLQNYFLLKFPHGLLWNCLFTHCKIRFLVGFVTICKEINFSLHFVAVTEVSRDFDKALFLLILERLQPPNLDNRSTFWRGVSKTLLSRQRLPSEGLWGFTGHDIMLRIITAG